MEEPKEDLRRLIINPMVDSKAKLGLIYSLYRLGLTYLFVEEIDGQLDKLFNELNLQDYPETDLYTISVHFQVFRNHGYKLSCGKPLLAYTLNMILNKSYSNILYFFDIA